jgi:gas vesicle protein GvpL/GvpF
VTEAGAIAFVPSGLCGARTPWDIIEADFEMDGTATYVYCILHAARTPGMARAPRGLAGATRPSIAPVTRSLSLVIATVPLASYGSGPLEASLQDMKWVADVAVAHEAVVEYFVRQAGITVIPMKLFTMFTSDARAIEETRSRGGDLEAVAKRIAGCEEWGVRIIRRAPASPPQRRPRDAKPSSGAAFLAAKKEARDLARAAAHAAAEAAARAFTTLASIARDARRRDDVPEGASSPPLLDAAFLVPATRRARFKAAVRKLAVTNAKAGGEVTLSGPWPSYNFIQDEGRT